MKRKLTVLELLLLCIPVAILVFPLAKSNSKGDKLEQTMQNMAGANAVDCGHVNQHYGYPKEMHACMAAAFKEGKPFKARTETYWLNRSPGGKGTWGWVSSHGYVGTPQGQVYDVFYFGRGWFGLARIEKRLWHSTIVVTSGEGYHSLSDSGRQRSLIH